VEAPFLIGVLLNEFGFLVGLGLELLEESDAVGFVGGLSSVETTTCWPVKPWQTAFWRLASIWAAVGISWCTSFRLHEK